MTRGDDQRIADILDACAELAAVVELRTAEAAPEQVLLRAAERLLEIIGEAAGAVSEQTARTYGDVDWRALSRLRIVLAHHYHRTDPRLVWNYAVHDAPALRAALEQAAESRD